MTLILDEADVRAHCDMAELVAAIERGLEEEAAGDLVMPPRQNIPMRHGMLRMMPVAMNASNLFGFKVFHTSKTGARFLVAIYDQEEGELLALVDGDHLTAARTGATAGVAARYLAREDASLVGVIGAGAEARTNFAAMCAVRPIQGARVFSPRRERREALAEEIRSQYGIDAQAVAEPDECVAGVDIAVVATNTMHAPDPIAFRGAWMEPGMHVSSIGSTMPILRELDAETFARAQRVVVDAPAQMHEECGDVIAAIDAGVYAEPVSLTEVAGGAAPGRERAEQITLFKSVGTAMQDVVAAFVVYEHAHRHGSGSSVDFLHLKPFPEPLALQDTP
jgi:alanine dehydrogenase